MSKLDRLTNNFRDTVDYLAEGWQELWNNTRNAITRFTPHGRQSADKAIVTGTTRWGVLSAELRETDKALEVELEAPGMDAGNFEVRVAHQALHIRGSRQYSNDRNEGHYHITERAYGSFERIIPLPCQVDEEQAKATYRKGVLAMVLPKHETQQPRKIVVA
jgi:HSP20 family protein